MLISEIDDTTGKKKNGGHANLGYLAPHEIKEIMKLIKKYDN
jgi:hypothetical protein